MNIAYAEPPCITVQNVTVTKEEGVFTMSNSLIGFSIFVIVVLVIILLVKTIK